MLLLDGPCWSALVHIIMVDWLALVHCSTFRQSIGALLCPAHQIPIHIKLINRGAVSSVFRNLPGLHVGAVIVVLRPDNLLRAQGSSLGLAKLVEFAHIFQRSDNIAVLRCAVGNGDMIRGHAHCDAHGQCAEYGPYPL